MFLAAVLQQTSTTDEERNWESARGLIERAAGYGANLVATPENTNFLGSPEEKARRAEALDGPVCSRFAALAEELRVHLLLGSFNERGPDHRRCYNTSVLFGPGGEILATYRKIHLFDVDVSEAVSFRESETVAPGDEPVTVTTDLGCIGLSVCYDLRFAELYRALIDRGAEILTVPSAFTATTGRAHWQPLLRTRAIECQAYVLAPAQYGRHTPRSDGGRGLRESHGQAMIVDPWGAVLATAADGPGLALAEIDLERVHRVRRSIPVSEHRRL